MGVFLCLYLRLLFGYSLVSERSSKCLIVPTWMWGVWFHFFTWLMSPQPRCPPHQHSFGSSYANEHSPITLPSLCIPLCAKLNELSSSPSSPDEFKCTPWTSGLISEKTNPQYAIHPQSGLPRASTLVFPTWSSESCYAVHLSCTLVLIQSTHFVVHSQS